MHKFLNKVHNAVPNLVVDLDDPVELRVLTEYGAVLVAQNGVAPPDRVIFREVAQVEEFQSGLSTRAENIGGYRVELQRPAMEALLEAIAEGEAAGLEIMPRGSDSARRNYEET